MSTTNLLSPTNLLPNEIDSILADLWVREQDARRKATDYRRISENESMSAYAERYAADVDRFDAEAKSLREDALPYEAEFRARGGWSRFFVVNNTGGHVHSSMDCSTCFVTTSFSWLPNLSGGTEEGMVAEFGEMACTVCFPSAPTFRGFGDGTSALARYSADEKAARDTEKAAKAAAKAEKAITAPDGSPLRTAGRWSETIKTVVAARNELSRLVQNEIIYARKDEDDVESIRRIEEALAAKGWTAEEIAKVKANAEKKARS